MTPELSHRVGAALNVLPPGRLGMADRMELADAVEAAATFEALPSWIQDLVVEGEGT